MKTIQWYPGHMAKAVRMMEENFTLCDGVALVLDARAPASSFNARALARVGGKPVVYILNKADLASAEADEWVAALKRSGKHALKTSAGGSASVRALQKELGQAAEEARSRRTQRDARTPMRFLVAGVPNTGKSTLINALAGGKRALTGDKAGVTRAKQWVKCGAFELLDTPGVMPPSCENQTFALRLAYLGCINDDILALDEIALALLEELSARGEALAERYGVVRDTPLAMLEQLCRRRGFLLQGGEADFERGERALLDDFRKGRLGKICLDSAADLAAAGLI